MTNYWIAIGGTVGALLPSYFFTNNYDVAIGIILGMWLMVWLGE